MPKDVIITPANSYMEFRDTNSNVDAMIYLDNSRNLNIFNPNGSLTLGNTAANVFIGDGTSVVDIVFEQNGSVRALTGKTLTLGQSDSSVAFAGNVTNGLRVSSGNVSIGTTNTSAAILTLQGTTSPLLRLVDVSAGGDVDMQFIPADTANTWTIGIDDSDADKFKIAEATTLGTAKDYLTIDINGNVGIGTASPTANLHVIGTANVSANLTVGAGAVGSPSLTTAGDNNTGIFFPAADTIAFTEGGSEVMRVTSTSNVAIGTTTASYKVDVTGDIRASGNMISVSDLRTKQNIQTINSALQKVVNLRGVYFNRIGSNTKHIGVIAQEVKEILPEVVSYTENEDRYSVAYGNMVGVLIEAIKEQNEKIVELENKLNQIKTD